METVLRIREVTPSECMADRLDREADRLPAAYQTLADDYRRQAIMLREMSEIRQMPVPGMRGEYQFACV